MSESNKEKTTSLLASADVALRLQPRRSSPFHRLLNLPSLPFSFLAELGD